MGQKYNKDNYPLCDICEIDIFKTNNYFMVSNKLWKKIADPETMLCIPCSENILGRRFKSNELNLITINK